MSAYGVKISRGTVTHWKDTPLETWEQAHACLAAIRDYTGEKGEIVEVIASIPLPAVSPVPAEKETPSQ